jgi:hypothetical protein
VNTLLLSPRVQRWSASLGLGLIAICAVLGIFFPTTFFEGYLTAFIFWVEIALGCMALLFLQYLTGGLWGVCITRLLEAGMMTLPWCGLFFLPLFLGLAHLFPWVHPVGEELQRLVRAKEAYLNVPFYILRFCIYFVVLSALATWFRRLSLRRDANDAEAFTTMQNWSGPALIVFTLLMNFASIDWVMSLKPEWYSSMLVVEFVGEQAVVTMAWCILILRLLSSIEPLRGALTVKVVHDLANLLLGFTCFWTYVTFMEYIITWTGNLPHQVSWFSDRSSTGWKVFAVVLVLVHFGIPLFCLIFTSISKNLNRLAAVAALMIVAHFLQVVWWVEPAFGPHFHLGWMSPVLIVGLGALWMNVFARNLTAAPLLVDSSPQPDKQMATA